MVQYLLLSRKMLVLCCAILCCVPATLGVTRYSTIHNNFASLRCDVANEENVVCEFKDSYLHIDNTGINNIYVYDTTRLSPSGFRYQVRLANRHNKPRSTYTVRDSGGKKHQIQSPQWGLAFQDKSGVKKLFITINCDNSNVNDDLTDRRMMHITVTRHKGRACDTIAKCNIDSEVDLYSGFNTLQAEVKNGTLSIGIGSQRLNQLTSMTVNNVGAFSQVACFVGAGACVDIERAVITCDTENPYPVMTRWTRKTLEEHFEQSIDPVEGFWQYLDRDMEDKWLKLGGRYTLAVVANDNGYDLIYIDGAQTRKSQWKEGMLKGHITKTAFSDNYDLMWVDATFEPITLDAYATTENGVLLTLHFPVYKSQMRMAKVLSEP